MRLYAERPGRLGRQLLADLLAVVWIVLAVLAGLAARDGLLALQGPGRALAEAGARFGDAFADAADAVRGIPLIGGELARALTPATGTGTDLVRTGEAYTDAVASVAAWAGVLVPLVATVPVLLGWLPLRLAYARRAGAAVLAREQAPDLLALRALGRVPVHRLVAVAPDPAAAWRQGDPTVVRRLAALELSDLGLHAPADPG